MPHGNFRTTLAARGVHESLNGVHCNLLANRAGSQLANRSHPREWTLSRDQAIIPQPDLRSEPVSQHSSRCWHERISNRSHVTSKRVFDAAIWILEIGDQRLASEAKESVAAIERLIPAGIKATRCLRVHSGIGSDAGHVAESIALMASLPPEDRAAIARATYETISLQFAAPSDLSG